jgi:hypothetical protein
MVGPGVEKEKDQMHQLLELSSLMGGSGAGFVSSSGWRSEGSLMGNGSLENEAPNLEPGIPIEPNDVSPYIFFLF